jgi:uncharacterized membrane protein
VSCFSKKERKGLLLIFVFKYYILFCLRSCQFNGSNLKDFGHLTSNGMVHGGVTLTLSVQYIYMSYSCSLEQINTFVTVGNFKTFLTHFSQLPDHLPTRIYICQERQFLFVTDQ